jgi:two-component system, cell cycle sensor histidine kinase and response regulator CckA
MTLSNLGVSPSDPAFHEIAGNSQFGLYLIQEDRFLYANPKMAEIFGYAQPELVALPSMYSLVLEVDHPLIKENMSACAPDHSSPNRFSFRGQKKDGSVIDVEVHSSATTYHGRAAILGTLLDVTNVRKIARIQRSNDDRFRSLTEKISDWIWETDDLWQFTYTNPKIRGMLGYEPEEVIGKSLFAFLHKSCVVEVSKTLQHYRSAQSACEQIEMSCLHRTHYIVVLESSCVPILGLNGEFCGFRGISRDITARMQTENALQKSEKDYRQLVERVQAIVWRCDADTFRFTFVNQQAEVLLDYSAARWTEEPGFWEKHIYPEDRDMALATCLNATQALRPHEIEYRMIAADGRTVWLRDIIYVVEENHVAKELIGIMVDITARKSAELAMYESQARLENIINSAMDAIITMDSSQKILIFNHAAERVFGILSADVIGQPIDRFIPERYRVNHRQHVVGFGRTGTTSRAMNALGTILGVRSNGEEFPLEASISQTDVSGQKLYTVILRDISERKKAEENLRRTEQQLLQAQKMEAIGRLAGGVAHDFNNLLTGIIGYAEITGMELEPTNPIYINLVQIRRAGQRAADLTRQLLAFSRQQVLQTRIIDLNEIIHESGKMLRRLIGEDVDFITHLEPRLGYIKADPGQIEQVIMNLSVNARDAMPGGGRLIFETSNVYLDESYVSQHLSSQTGPHVLLSVTDNGIGMNAETRAHIFEPFFTTKEIGKGTGLGLSTVYGIIQQSGGAIWVYSEPGEGTTFKIYLPCVEPPEATQAEAEAPKEPSRGTERILLVEDDELVRGLTSKTLQMGGYQVLEATNGEEAIALCEQNRNIVDLLITDIVMPKLRGEELAKRLRSYCPDMTILYMSGYTENAIIQNGALDSCFNFLPKPFTPVELMRLVRGLLEKRKGRKP